MEEWRTLCNQGPYLKLDVRLSDGKVKFCCRKSLELSRYLWQNHFLTTSSLSTVSLRLATDIMVFRGSKHYISLVEQSLITGAKVPSYIQPFS